MTATQSGPAVKSIRTLQLGSGWLPEEGGGLNRYYYDLIHRLPEAGVAARGLVVGSQRVESESTGVVRAFAAADVPLRSRLFRQHQAVRDALHAGRFDLVAAHFAPYAWPALRHLRRVPLVVHFHGPWAAESRAEGGGSLACWGKGKIEQSVYGRASRLIVLSEAFGRVLQRDYGVSFDRVRVVPGGVDTARFDVPETRSAARLKLSWPTDRPIVLCARRLVSRMGLENLISAAAVVRRLIPDILFVIAGTGPLGESLAAKIAADGLGEHVRLAGFIPDADLPLAYRAADLTVLPSTSLEGFGLSAAESLAAGTPVMVTSVGGLPEVVRPLSPDLMLPSSEPAPMAEALAAALRGTTSIPDGDACRLYAARFDWGVVVRRIRQVYEEVL